MKPNLFKLVRNVALYAALAITLVVALCFGAGNLHRDSGAAIHGLAGHALLADGVETHGGKKPPKSV